MADAQACADVQSFKEEQLDAIRAASWEQRAEWGHENVCAAVAGDRSAAARRVDSACTSGKRWAKITNAMYLSTLASAAATGYFFYRSRTAPEDGPLAGVRVAPTLAPGHVGIGIDLSF
jgi:hypothetical protein